mgnify:CR=1 FL=1
MTENHFNKSGEQRSRVVALGLLLAFNVFGIHNFYLGRRDIAMTQFILTLFGALTAFLFIGLIPLFVVVVRIIVDVFKIATVTDDSLTWKIF